MEIGTIRRQNSLESRLQEKTKFMLNFALLKWPKMPKTSKSYFTALLLWKIPVFIHLNLIMRMPVRDNLHKDQDLVYVLLFS